MKRRSKKSAVRVQRSVTSPETKAFVVRAEILGKMSSEELQQVLLKRAFMRQSANIERVEATLANMRLKHNRQRAELARQMIRIYPSSSAVKNSGDRK